MTHGRGKRCDAAQDDAEGSFRWNVDVQLGRRLARRAADSTERQQRRTDGLAVQLWDRWQPELPAGTDAWPADASPEGSGRFEDAGQEPFAVCAVVEVLSLQLRGGRKKALHHAVTLLGMFTLSRRCAYTAQVYGSKVVQRLEPRDGLAPHKCTKGFPHL
jgi:hypothetical protein